MVDKVQLVLTVNGEDVFVDANPNEPLLACVARALGKTGNAGRPPEEWEVRDANGGRLEISRKVGEFKFAEGTRLFLNLAVAAGG